MKCILFALALVCAAQAIYVPQPMKDMDVRKVWGSSVGVEGQEGLDLKNPKGDQSEATVRGHLCPTQMLAGAGGCSAQLPEPHELTSLFHFWGAINYKWEPALHRPAWTGW